MASYGVIHWRKGNYEADLIWSLTRGGTFIVEVARLYNLHVYGYECGAQYHRLDGPARMGSYATAEELAGLSEVSSPDLLDEHFRQHDSHLFWSISDLDIHEVEGKLTYQFPNMTTESIRTGMEACPKDVAKWLMVAKKLKLMDVGLRKLNKSLGLLAP